MKTKHKWAALALVVVGIVSAIGGAVFLQTEDARADTDTKNTLTETGKCWNDWFRVMGAFPDLDRDARKQGELFTRTVAYYSFDPLGESLPITVQGVIQSCTSKSLEDFFIGLWGFGDIQITYAYVFFIDNGDGFKPLYASNDIPEGKAAFTFPLRGLTAVTRYPFDAFEFQIDGYEFCNVPIVEGKQCPADERELIVHGAVLKVAVVLGTTKHTDSHFALDELNLFSARGTCTWERDAYQVGETAVLNCDVPVVFDERGVPMFYLTVVDENTNRAVGGWDDKPLREKGVRISIPVTADLFQGNGTCVNRLFARLSTQLVTVAGKRTSIQPDAVALRASGGTPPTVETITFNADEYFEGDTVKVSWTTSGKVTKVFVAARIGPFERTFWFNGSDPGAVSFVAPITGMLQVEVVAYADCLPSAVKTEYIGVGNRQPAYCTSHPDDPACRVADNAGAIAILVALVFGALAFLYVFVTVHKPLPLKLALALVAAVVVAVVVYLVVAAAVSAWAGIFGGLVRARASARAPGVTT